MNQPKLNVDEGKLNEFMGKALADMGAAANMSLILIGDRLGLYKAMAGAGPMTSQELATKTGTSERYVREWLPAQAAGGYVSFAAGKFTLPDEQAMALAVDNSPAFIPGAYQIIASTVLDEPKVRAAFKTGEGVGWHEHNCTLFEGTERFFSSQLFRSFDRRMDSGACWSGGETEGGSNGCRCRLRLWRLHYSYGARLSEIEIHRVRLSRSVDRMGQRVSSQSGSE
jgi:hypothetical protein